ncbi:outer membrane protein assembly factor BamB family protein [Paenibacillus sp. DMB20]|uniref:outer membrane protein assembly factor BamB family protein n=1 Tax=Paenibacillus sp. DMB20 TaxID=1642570 RepID=UPI00069CB672|nr:PQQ-binding-like beta-propeller repeat protein [Paenibacillus sp. DMB20]
MSVLDSETGKERWKKALPGDYRILNHGTDDPYVLIQQNGEVKAYDPANGKVAWSFKVKGPQMEDPARDPYYTGGYRSLPLSPADGSARWMLLGREWKLVDLQSGKAKAVYPAAKGERFEVLDDRYLLVHRGTGEKEEDYYGAKAYETVLYDAVEQRKAWTLKGRGTKGIMDGDTIYMALNGIPAAVDTMTGKVRWVMSTSSKTNEDLSHLASSSFAVLERYLLLAHGHDLLVLGKEDGKVLGRLHDVYAGSAELRELDARNGSLNAEADELYAGTANGAFIRYDVKALEKRLDGLD